MYHRIGASRNDDPNLWISEEHFRRQLAILRSGGFSTLTLDEAFTAVRARRHPPKTVLLTFDDAFDETLATASPILVEAGMSAATFVPAGFLGQSVELRHPAARFDSATKGTIADSGRLRRWLEVGHQVGSHSLSHRGLPALSDSDVLAEARESKGLLEDTLGHSVDDFCYPFTHHDERVRRLVQKAGYRCSYAGEPPRFELDSIPRMMVYPQDTAGRFRRKVSGYYYWITAWHRRFVRD